MMLDCMLEFPVHLESTRAKGNSLIMLIGFFSLIPANELVVSKSGEILAAVFIFLLQIINRVERERDGIFFRDVSRTIFSKDVYSLENS